jgi:hypothetical protein
MSTNRSRARMSRLSVSRKRSRSRMSRPKQQTIRWTDHHRKIQAEKKRTNRAAEKKKKKRSRGTAAVTCGSGQRERVQNGIKSTDMRKH